MKTEHRIAYKAGIRRRPSDFLCEDGELAECVNMTTDSEELKVMVPPKAVDGLQIASGTRLSFVHKTAGGKIYLSEGSGGLSWTANVGLAGTLPVTGSINGIQAIGNVLIVATSGGLKYWRWNVNTYTAMPSEIPYPRLRCRLLGTEDPTGASSYRVQSSGSYTGIVESDGESASIVEGEEAAFNELVVGLYERNKKLISQSEGFCEPFFVRAALKLSDGSYWHISQPILLFPSVRGNSVAAFNTAKENVYLATAFKRLQVIQTTDYSAWGDIVKDVVLFITSGVPVYDLAADQGISYTTADQGDSNGCIVDGIFATPASSIMDYRRHIIGTWNGGIRSWEVLNHRYKEDIEADIRESSVFYRLCSLGTTAIGQWKDISTDVQSSWHC